MRIRAFCWILGVFLVTACTTPATSRPAASVASTPATSTATSALPPQVWIDAAAAPMDSGEQWPKLADVAHFPAGKFWVDDFCATPNPLQNKGVESGVASVERGQGNWSLRQTMLHYAGDPWTMGQAATADFTELAASLQQCGAAKVTVTTDRTRCPAGGPGICKVMAAEIAGGADNVSAHVYLAQVGAAVTELVVWSVGPAAHPWIPVDDSRVLTAMTPQLCQAWQC